jgi:hypothetical protein
MKKQGKVLVGIEAIEIMDEFEEWNLLLRHYSIVVACKGQLNLVLKR